MTCRALWLHYAHSLLSILPPSIFFHSKMKSSPYSSFSLVMQMNSVSLIKIILIIENNAYGNIATAYMSSFWYLSLLWQNLPEFSFRCKTTFRIGLEEKETMNTLKLIENQFEGEAFASHQSRQLVTKNIIKPHTRRW